MSDRINGRCLCDCAGCQDCLRFGGSSHSDVSADLRAALNNAVMAYADLRARLLIGRAEIEKPLLTPIARAGVGPEVGAVSATQYVHLSKVRRSDVLDIIDEALAGPER